MKYDCCQVSYPQTYQTRMNISAEQVRKLKNKKIPAAAVESSSILTTAVKRGKRSLLKGGVARFFLICPRNSSKSPLGLHNAAVASHLFLQWTGAGLSRMRMFDEAQGLLDRGRPIALCGTRLAYCRSLMA